MNLTLYLSAGKVSVRQLRELSGSSPTSGSRTTFHFRKRGIPQDESEDMRDCRDWDYYEIISAKGNSNATTCHY